MARYHTTAQFLENRFDVDLKIYINADQDAKERIEEIKKPGDTNTKLSELEGLRLIKPDATQKSITDIVDTMLTRRKFMIRPSYQRKEVINPRKASAIIESILLGITLPAIFVFKKSDNVYEVIDGQQRLLTILGFMGAQYINEKGDLTFSKNNKFALRQLRILHNLNGQTFHDLETRDQDKIYDFLLYVVQIEQKQNEHFNPIDLFIRLNDKPYPIRENSFEMWNSWADNSIIKSIKDLKTKLDPWFYLRKIVKSSDRDRMENEELFTSLAYLEYNNAVKSTVKALDVYQKTDRINARISTKARISALMQEVSQDDTTKAKFSAAIKSVSSFAKKVKTVLLDSDKTKEELVPYLRQELDEIFKAGKEARYFRRTIQDFYFMWLFLESLNLEMVRHHRLTIKKEIKEAFMFFKNIPEQYWEDNQGYLQFEELLNSFKLRYTKDERKIKLSDEEKLEFIQNQNNRSSLSEAPIFLGDDIEVDHVEPLAIGGKDDYTNLGISHDSENRAKGIKQNDGNKC